MNTRGLVESGDQRQTGQIMAPRRRMLLAAFVVASCCVATAQTGPKITGFLVDGVKSNRAAVGAILTIQGEGFGATIGFSTATLAGTPLAGPGVRAISWSDTSIVAVIPQTAISGPVVVKVKDVPSDQKKVYVRVEIMDVSCNVNPCNSGPVGTLVILTGNGFGTQGGKVTFNGVEAVTGGWSDASINALVPPGATTGPIRVSVAGQVSNGWHFTVTP